MTRTWAPIVEDIQQAIRNAVLAERTAQAASLPAGLQGTDFTVRLATSATQPESKPYTVLVLPPERARGRPEVTGGMEFDPLEFRLMVEIRTDREVNHLVLLREVVFLILDAIQVDPTLGGLVSGWAQDGFEAQDLTSGPGIVAQDVVLRFVARA